jgi:1-deoxy-D-xylulose-5-phosphate reductoisomerase
VLNAANEIAVEAFLEQRLAFTEIPGVIARVLNEHDVASVESLDHVLQADEWARHRAREAVTQAARVFV